MGSVEALVTSRPLPPAVLATQTSPDQFVSSQQSGRALGRETNKDRANAVRVKWGEYLDQLKEEDKHITADRAGCMLYAWWSSSERLLFDDELPGRKRSYKPEYMIDFAREWAKISRVWTSSQ